MKFLHYRILSGWRDSNSRPPAPKAGILTGLNYIPHTFLSKASAKVLLFFDMTKYFHKKMQKKCIFLNISVFFSTFAVNFRIRAHTYTYIGILTNKYNIEQWIKKHGLASF